MSLLDVPTDIEAITEYGLTSAAHDTELSAQIRQVLRLRGLRRPLRNTRAAGRATEHVAQDLAKDITARLEKQGVLMHAAGPQKLRACTHLDISKAQAERAAETIRQVIAKPVRV